MTTHKDLEVWKKSVEFVTRIYKVSGEFPKEEIYGITSQIRRASVSITCNIAEGAGRGTPREFAHFLSIVLGSVAETETLLLIAKNLNLISENSYNELNNTLTEIRRMSIGLKNSLNER
jgi:four helix bundle protein